MEGSEIQFNLKEELFKYLYFWKWILFSCILFVTSTYLYLRYESDIYSTQAKIQILDQSNNTFKLPTNSFNIFGENEKDLENEIELFRSTRIFNKVIDSLELQTAIFSNGTIKTIELWDTAPFKIAWGIEKNELKDKNISFELRLNTDGYTINNDAKKYAYNTTNFNYGIPFSVVYNNSLSSNKQKDFLVVLKSKNQVIQELTSNLTITKQGNQSNILKLVLKGGNTSKINAILGALIATFDNDGVNDRQLVFEKTIEFVDSRFHFLFSELDSIEQQKATYKKSQGLSFIEADANVLMQKNYTSGNEIEKIETQLALTELMFSALQSNKENELLPVNLGITNYEINALSNKYNEIIINRNKFINEGGGKSNPLVASLTQQINPIKNNLKATIVSYKNTLNYQKNEWIKINGSSFKNYSRIPENEKSLRAIERQQNIKESLYILLLQKREEAAVNLAITNPTIKLIEYPNYNKTPIFPDRTLFYSLAFIVGLVLPLIIIYIYFVSNDKLQSKLDLEARIKLPIIGEIPFVHENENKLIRAFDRSVLSESFRILRTNLLFLQGASKKNKNQVIFVTSSIKGEGKTFVSLNLAITLASTNKKVILLGADLRNPQLHTMLTYNRIGKKGISDFIFDETISLKDIITTKEDNQNYKLDFDVIFSGTIPPNPAELLASPRFKEIIDTLKENYDYVIVDTAPTLLVTDTTMISNIAETIIFVTRANYTEKKLIKHIEEFHQINNNESQFGLLINNVGQNKIYSTSYAYSYNYGYGYGYEKDYTRRLSFKHKIARWFRKKT